MTIMLLLNALLVASFQGNLLPQIELQTGRNTNIGVPLGRLDLYDGLMVATVLSPAIACRLPGDDYLAVQRVRVDDSRAFARGSIVEVYYTAHLANLGPALQGTVIDQEGAPPVGARVLLVARAAKDGILRVPDLNRWEVPDKRTLTLPAGSPPAAYGETFFLTSRAALAPVADPKWRFLESLAQAIPHTGDANAVEITDFMHTFAGQKGPDPFGQADDRLSKTFADAVANDTPYHRALVDVALNGLYYWGYGDRFYVNLRVAADDPGAFPGGVPELGFWEQVGTGSNPKLPKDFKHDSGTTWDKYRLILRHAKSPTVSAWLLQNMPKPSDADVHSMARFLDSPDPRLRRAFVERLAAWSGERAPAEPVETLAPNGTPHREYPGLDAAVARWKTRLRTASKPG